MPCEFTQAARRLGVFSASTTAVLLVAYASTLAVGFWSLESPQEPIGGITFVILEVLILILMPAMVGLMVAVHAWVPMRARSLSLTALVFMGMLAGVTCSVHFVILTLSRQAAFVDQPWLSLFLSFEWPSVAYALDILGWDVFFPMSMLFAAAALSGDRLARWIRGLMVASGVLALAGLSGVVVGDMRLRNVHCRLRRGVSGGGYSAGGALSPNATLHSIP